MFCNDWTRSQEVDLYDVSCVCFLSTIQLFSYVTEEYLYIYTYSVSQKKSPPQGT